MRRKDTWKCDATEARKAETERFRSYASEYAAGGSSTARRDPKRRSATAMLPERASEIAGLAPHRLALVICGTKQWNIERRFGDACVHTAPQQQKPGVSGIFEIEDFVSTPG